MAKNLSIHGHFQRKQRGQLPFLGSLLRRLRQDGDLPRIHSLVNTLNALSVAHAIPIAVFDLSKVQGDLEVRLASGTERFVSFSGEHETPEPGEAVFVDSTGHAHARNALADGHSTCL